MMGMLTPLSLRLDFQPCYLIHEIAVLSFYLAMLGLPYVARLTGPN